jgi:Protein of unknown function (DUF3455)
MKTRTNGAVRHGLDYSIVVVAAGVLMVGCGYEAPVGPPAEVAGAIVSADEVTDGNRVPDLGGCDSLAAPIGSTLAFQAFATGVQIYRWTGATWTFVAPSATLFADAGGNGAVGIHYAGPTWESMGGSKVVGTVSKRCTPDANAIPWLLLRAVSADGPGIFDRVAFIRRLNTRGGTAPAQAGSVVGELASVPYTAEYFFYRAP